jgi:1,4-dihydroxy-2-naphthoyl-CoA hydrolase
MSYFRPGITIEILNKFSANTLAGHLGIEVTEIGEDSITAKMPVDHRTAVILGHCCPKASAVKVCDSLIILSI